MAAVSPELLLKAAKEIVWREKANDGIGVQAVNYDPLTHTFLIRVWHRNFSPVPEGETIPRIALEDLPNT